MKLRKDVAELLERVRAVGWTVVDTTDGYQIRCPDGEAVTVHRTPSDRNWATLAVARLASHGLTDAEATAAQRLADQRTVRLAAQRRQASDHIARAADSQEAQQHALRRAAGLLLDHSVLLAPQSTPAMYRVEIGPELARRLLGRNTANRRIRPGDVDMLARQMCAGDWQLTHQGIALDTNGVLQDGQHRLAAIITADQSVEMMVAVGMPHRTVSVVDTGRARSHADILALHGERHTTQLGSACRLLYLYDHVAYRQWKTTRVSAAETLATLEANPTMRHITGPAASQARHLDITVSALIVGTVLIDRAWPPATRDRFLDGLTSGHNLAADDARLALRRWLHRPPAHQDGRRRRNSAHHLIGLIRTYNAWAQQRPLSRIRAASNDPLPTITTPPAARPSA